MVGWPGEGRALLPRRPANHSQPPIARKLRAGIYQHYSYKILLLSPNLVPDLIMFNGALMFIRPRGGQDRKMLH